MGGLRWGDVDEFECVKAFQGALDAGINFIDTADAYGKGKSEKYIGGLPTHQKDSLVIATKVGVEWNHDGSRSTNLSKAYIERAVDKSLKNMNLDKIDIYYLHEPDPKTDINETLEAMHRLQVLGKVRYFGLSNFPRELIQLISKSIKIAVIQDEFNLINLIHGENAVEIAKNLGVGFCAYSPLSRGLLTGKFSANVKFSAGDNRFENNQFIGDVFKTNLERVRKFDDYCRSIGCSTIDAAIAWLLRFEYVSSVIIGARNIRQLDQQLKASSLELTECQHQEIRNIFLTKND